MVRIEKGGGGGASGTAVESSGGAVGVLIVVAVVIIVVVERRVGSGSGWSEREDIFVMDESREGFVTRGGIYLGQRLRLHCENDDDI